MQGSGWVKVAERDPLCRRNANVSSKVRAHARAGVEMGVFVQRPGRVCRAGLGGYARYRISGSNPGGQNLGLFEMKNQVPSWFHR